MIATSYLNVRKVDPSVANDIRTAKSPKSEVEYILARIMKETKVINCAVIVPRASEAVLRTNFEFPVILINNYCLKQDVRFYSPPHLTNMHASAN